MSLVVKIIGVAAFVALALPRQGLAAGRLTTAEFKEICEISGGTMVINYVTHKLVCMYPNGDKISCGASTCTLEIASDTPTSPAPTVPRASKYIAAAWREQSPRRIGRQPIGPGDTRVTFSPQQVRRFSRLVDAWPGQ